MRVELTSTWQKIVEGEALIVAEVIDGPVQYVDSSVEPTINSAIEDFTLGVDDALEVTLGCWMRCPLPGVTAAIEFESITGGAPSVGFGVPAGGTTGQVLAKASNAAGDTVWNDAADPNALVSGDIGVTVQAHDADLDAIAALTPSNDDIIQRKAGSWVSRTLAQLMTDLGALGTTFQPLAAALTSWAGVTRASGFDTFAATPSSANLRALLSDEVGTGAAYFVGGALGTPASATLTNATGLPVSTGISGLGSNMATFLATPSSANLRGTLTDETGTGAAVFATSPAIATPALTDPVITGTITEDVFTITDAAGFAIDPRNGSIQQVTLGANRTPTAANWVSGDSIHLKVADGTAFTITWTTIGVVWVGDSAPTLATSGFSHIVLWRDGTTYYGKYVGDTAS